MDEEFSAGHLVAPQGTWLQCSTHGEHPSARSYPATGTVGEKICVFGGIYDPFDSPGAYESFDDLHVFDTVTCGWTRMERLGEVPSPRGFSASVGVDEADRFYIFGGATYGPNYSGFAATSDLWEYSPSSNRWRLLAPAGGGPEARSLAHFFYSEGKLYLFGGVGSPGFRCMNDLWAYDIEDDRWTQLAPNDAPGSPPTRCQVTAGAVPVDGRLVIHGGETFDPASRTFVWLSDTWEYDLADGAWTDVTPAIVPARQNYGSSCVIDEVLYLHGGEQPYDKEHPPAGSTGCCAPFPQNPSDQVWKFVLAEKSWARVRPEGGPVAALKRTNSSACGGSMYIFCGYGWRCEKPGDPGQLWNTNVFKFQP